MGFLYFHLFSLPNFFPRLAFHSVIASFFITHRKKSYPLLHAVHVFFFAAMLLFLFFSLTCPFFQTSSLHSPISSEPYHTIPNSSVCSCLDSLPVLFLSKSHLASNSLCSRRQVSLLCSFLLLLAGDVSLNPGPQTKAQINVACLNICSANSVTESRDKPALIQEFISDQDLDVLFLTETWLSADTPVSALNLLTPTGYTFINHPRPDGKRGGGIAAVVRNTFSLSKVSTESFPSFFEHMALKISSSSRSYVFNHL